MLLPRYNIGLVYQTLGDTKKGVEYCEQALKMKLYIINSNDG